MKTNWILAAAVAIILLVIGFWYWAPIGKEVTKPIETIEEAMQAVTEMPVYNDAIQEAASNPVQDKLPELNPIEKTNPFKYQNPFSQ